MADTTLTLASNRYQNKVFLSASSVTVPMDASTGETFRLPVGFGQLLIEACRVTISAFSGAYVAPTPPFDGALFAVRSSDNATAVDFMAAERFVLTGNTTTTPHLTVVKQMIWLVLMRQDDRIIISAPVLAGAGVTATVFCALRGRRIMTA